MSREKRQEGVATRTVVRGYKETLPTLRKKGERKKQNKIRRGRTRKTRRWIGTIEIVRRMWRRKSKMRSKRKRIWSKIRPNKRETVDLRRKITKKKKNIPTNKKGKPSNNMINEERIMWNSISLYIGELSVILQRAKAQYFSLGSQVLSQITHFGIVHKTALVLMFLQTSIFQHVHLLGWHLQASIQSL